MQLYPQEEYLTGDDLLTEYNPECIAMVTDLLTPDRVNIMWLSKSFSEECNVQEKWFGIKYSLHGNSHVYRQLIPARVQN